ncbi:dynein axonemal assembly factor 9-like isoform X1 [Haliotis rufescens]|uniref:dynein axonemal assembly factor 9-like isoform X1 n=1 Tax=Haliotis rufescens TaxID=6454 RepID=UPI00201EC20A|nr:dynein axonemal assembly factor 9-like isoform X1 [Haliotis rufescens]
MASRRLKRPSSARRHIKYESFSQYVSASRLRQVQSLLKGPTDSSTAPDAILCIAGIDSRYNDGTRELINYLLFGFFEVRKEELESSGFEEEVIDDIVFLVRKTSVDVYCNPINYHYLLPYISHWYNVRFHCMTDTEYEDEEEAEEFKIHSFINIVRDSTRVGIPYSSSGHVHQFDKFAVEKWPIVQAYALEGLGGGGFFTMIHEVCDVSGGVHELYSRMDPVALEVQLTEHLPLLERQWKNMTATMDIEIAQHTGDLSEERLFEPLRSYFQHGRGAASGDGRSRKLPFVLFGSHASKTELLQAQDMDGYNSKKSSMKGETTHTILCQAVDPKGPLTCARTYFYTPVYDPFSDEDKSTDLKNSDVGYLMLVYKAMAEAVMKGIKTYAHTLSVTQARLKAVQTLHDDCGDLKTSSLLNYLSDRSSVKFTIEAVDNCGRPSSLRDGSQSLLVKVATMTLYDVPSCHGKGHLSSLVFAESFLDSVIPVSDPGQPETISSDVLVLTSHLPRFQMWASSKADSLANKDIQERLRCKSLPGFGDVLMHGEAVHLTTGDVLTSPPCQDCLYLYENGLIVQASQYGAFSLMARHVKGFSLYDGDSISNVAFLIADLDVTARARLPPHLLSSNNRLVIAIPPRSKARKALFQQVLPVWKGDSDMPEVKRQETLPEDLSALHNLLQIQHTSAENIIAPINTITFKRVPSVLPHINRFLPHFVASSVGWHPVQQHDLNSLLKQETPPPSAETEWIPVTILTGVPGCHKENLARTITSFDKDNTRWTTICQPHDNSSVFDPVSLQNSLTSAYSANRRRHTSGNYKRTRVVVLTPGYTDIIDVVHAIVSHPNTEVAAQIRIGAVTACVDPLNTFMEHRLTFPTLLNHCSQGWVNCIVFTSSISTKNETLEEVQNLVRSINSDVALLLAERGVVRRSPDLELIMSESSFHLPQMVAARQCLHPGWRQGIYLRAATAPPMNQEVLHFSKPLDRNKLHKSLRDLHGRLNKHRLEDNIYHVEGRLRFTDSRQIVELQFVTLSGFLTSSPSDDQAIPPSRQMNGQPLHDCFLTFSGCGLQEDKLKDWLRLCAQQKPEKKKPVSRGGLTKEEISRIHKTHHLEALPPGWFYNGTQFLSMGGDKSSTHPNLEEFITNWVKSKNNEISTYNAQIEAEAFTDLFD